MDAKLSREFMLTFDDGPLPDATDRVLDALVELRASDGKPVRAGFFLIGDTPDNFWQSRSYHAPYEIWTVKGSIVKYPRLTQRIKQLGHLIGNHTANHAWFRWPWLNTPSAIRNELCQWEAAAGTIFDASSPRLFRPPYLIDSEIVCEIVRQAGYQMVMGEAVGDTTPGITVKQIKQKAKRILAAWNQPYPCVLIFHDTLPITYKYLGEIVHFLQQRGFRLVHFNPTGIQNRGKSSCRQEYVHQHEPLYLDNVASHITRSV
jgi:peptidoglycan/xylan/chitin deacetylase (PgdA/CDA1 family)